VKCDDVAAAIPDYLTDGLDPTARKSVQAHLAECPSCRAEVEGLSETWARLRVLEDARPSPSLRAGFYAMLEAYPRDAEEMPRAPERRGWSRWAGTWAWQTAAAVLVLLAGVGLGRWSQARPGDLPWWTRPGPGGHAPSARPLLAPIHRPTAGRTAAGRDPGGPVGSTGRGSRQRPLDAVDNDPNVNVRSPP
jgi:anti-sigma factor RsiW